MIRHRFQAKSQEPAASIDWKLRITNQTAAKNHQRKTGDKKANERCSIQVLEVLKDLKGEKGDDGTGCKPPILKECLPSVAILLCFHSVANLPHFEEKSSLPSLCLRLFLDRYRVNRKVKCVLRRRLFNLACPLLTS